MVDNIWEGMQLNLVCFLLQTLEGTLGVLCVPSSSYSNGCLSPWWAAMRLSWSNLAWCCQNRCQNPQCLSNIQQQYQHKQDHQHHLLANRSGRVNWLVRDKILKTDFRTPSLSLLNKFIGNITLRKLEGFRTLHPARILLNSFLSLRSAAPLSSLWIKPIKDADDHLQNVSVSST